MTEPMTTIEAVHILNAAALERARRLQFAVALLRQGLSRREVSGKVWERYRCHRSTAWRLVDMAADMVQQKEPA